MNKNEEVILKLQNELNKFTKQYPILKHFMVDSFNDHKNRYKDDLNLINKNYKGGKVLDIGSNPFHLLFCLKELGYEATGLDINPEPFKKFIEKYDLRVEKCDIEGDRLPFESNSFDFIIFNEVFEHLRINPIYALKEIYRILKPNGIILLTTPNLYAIHKIIMFNFGKSFNNAYDEFNKLNIYGYVGHVREYSTQEVREFLDKSGFKVVSINYRNPYPFYKHAGYKDSPMKIVGLIADLVVAIVPEWRRDQAFIATKI